MFCGLESREAIFDKAQQWKQFSHSASRIGIAPFLWWLHAIPSPSDSEILWGTAGLHGSGTKIVQLFTTGPEEGACNGSCIKEINCSCSVSSQAVFHFAVVVANVRVELGEGRI